MQIITASEEHIDDVARLFDLYRQFYECDADLELARDYVAARIEHSESIIYLAVIDEAAVGFVQIYPSFCSVEAITRLILYDLYVDAEFRKRGVAYALMERARKLATDCGAARIDLETAFDNLPGQALYEKLGYKRADGFHTYSLDCRAR